MTIGKSSEYNITFDDTSNGFLQFNIKHLSLINGAVMASLGYNLMSITISIDCCYAKQNIQNIYDNSQ